MACTITAPTLQACNDLQGGVKTLEVAPWIAGFDAGTATWTTIPLLPNSSYGKETPTVSAENQTVYFTHEVFFKVNGLSNFTGWANLVKGRVCARVTGYDSHTIAYGIESGLSFSGGERGTGQNMEDTYGSTLTFTGVSSVTATEV